MTTTIDFSTIYVPPEIVPGRRHATYLIEAERKASGVITADFFVWRGPSTGALVRGWLRPDNNDALAEFGPEALHDPEQLISRMVDITVDVNERITAFGRPGESAESRSYSRYHASQPSEFKDELRAARRVAHANGTTLADVVAAGPNGPLAHLIYEAS